MTPDEAIVKIVEILDGVQGGWQEELGDDAPVTLRGFYLCADYGNFERTGVFFALSGDGNGQQLTPWAVEGYLHHALSGRLFGFEED